MGTGSDLVVESKGHCFLCLDLVPVTLTHPSIIKLEPGLEESELDLGLSRLLSPSPTSSLSPTIAYSLQSLSRYLNMDMGTVFNPGETIPRDLLAKVERSQLKAELCPECAQLVGQFSEWYRQLEAIEMKLMESLKLIRGKLSEEGKDNTEMIGKLISSGGGGGSYDWTGKLEILKVLRMEVIQKGSRKLNFHRPRVKVKNLSKMEIRKCQDKIADKSNILCHRDSEIDIRNVKVEEMECPSDDPDLVEGHLDNSECCSNNEDSESATPGSSPTKLTKKGSSFVVIPSSNPDHSPELDELQYRKFDAKSGKYECLICQKQFSLNRNFTAHYRSTHLKHRYHCTICGKSFSHPSSCRKHSQATHAGVTFNCSVCSRVFAHKFHLTRHLDKTSCGKGVAPKPKKHVCECNLCGKGFTEVGSLRKHFKQIHGQSRGHQCDLCGQAFKRAAHLKNHQKTVHRGEVV